MEHQDKSINYIEFPLLKTEETKSFYGSVFGWLFEDWGPNYISFSGAGVEGGFNGESGTPVQAPGVLVVLYAKDLAGTLATVREAGGKILQEIYSFPGGQRFHFADPNGNELAVWTEASS
ncbi:Glyoxalase/bleomycin resistance protein/dioxygenase [Pseudovibrio sp. FO-BEG1]|uniref:VOC domain-containing protein n=1 Tax=Pseudovibrio denitrificans TaxID=258256 RepID=A0A1I6XPT8_9HYPH|nr:MULTISPECIES: VOC family protein [Pseudovibrio]AEV37404.1 Glyoxalase/bleomycin resistance protein/dioxygenase [Pseudovibrio sp. FO-BEG1]SFT39931.1 hypothetical protein SAMN05444141_101334 [Pseudovibrio denitrificans]